MEFNPTRVKERDGYVHVAAIGLVRRVPADRQPIGERIVDIDVFCARRAQVVPERGDAGVLE